MFYARKVSDKEGEARREYKEVFDFVVLVVVEVNSALNLSTRVI